jgi:hypothetical protein
MRLAERCRFAIPDPWNVPRLRISRDTDHAGTRRSRDNRLQRRPVLLLEGRPLSFRNAAQGHPPTAESTDGEGSAPKILGKRVVSFRQVRERKPLPGLGCVSPSWGTSSRI